MHIPKFAAGHSWYDGPPLVLILDGEQGPLSMNKRKLGRSGISVALAWLIAHPGVAAPIASATSVEQLSNLTAATRLTLPVETIADLDRASD